MSGNEISKTTIVIDTQSEDLGDFSTYLSKPFLLAGTIPDGSTTSYTPTGQVRLVHDPYAFAIDGH